jgi:hypothetical protein
MTKKDFFRVVIKLLGTYSIFTTLFSGFLINLSAALFDFNSSALFWTCISLSIIILLCIILINKVDSIINLLNLDKGFDDERIDFNKFDFEKLIKVSCILIGGYLFVSNLSPFIAQVLIIFKSNNIGTPLHNNEKFLFIYISNLIIGYLLFTNYDVATNFLKNKKGNSIIDENVNEQR